MQFLDLKDASMGARSGWREDSKGVCVELGGLAGEAKQHSFGGSIKTEQHLGAGGWLRR